MRLLTLDYGALTRAVWTLKGGVLAFVLTLGMWPLSVLLFGTALLVMLLTIDVVLLLPIRLAIGGVGRRPSGTVPVVRVRVTARPLPPPDRAARLPAPRR